MGGGGGSAVGIWGKNMRKEKIRVENVKEKELKRKDDRKIES